MDIFNSLSRLRAGVMSRIVVVQEATKGTMNRITIDDDSKKTFSNNSVFK